MNLDQKNEITMNVSKYFNVLWI